MTPPPEVTVSPMVMMTVVERLYHGQTLPHLDDEPGELAAGHWTTQRRLTVPQQQNFRLVYHKMHHRLLTIFYHLESRAPLRDQMTSDFRLVYHKMQENTTRQEVIPATGRLKSSIPDSTWKIRCPVNHSSPSTEHASSPKQVKISRKLLSRRAAVIHAATCHEDVRRLIVSTRRQRLRSPAAGRSRISPFPPAVSTRG